MVSREHDLQCLFLLVHYHMFLYPIGQHLNQHFNHLWDVFFLAIEVWCRVAHGDPQICHDDHRFTQSEILSL